MRNWYFVAAVEQDEFETMHYAIKSTEGAHDAFLAMQEEQGVPLTSKCSRLLDPKIGKVLESFSPENDIIILSTQETVELIMLCLLEGRHSVS